MEAVQAYAYRKPRLEFRLRVEYNVGAGSISGYTENLSDDGVLVRLAAPVASDSTGKLRLSFEGCVVEIGARVAYTEFLHTGLSFCFSSDAERQFIQTLMRLMAKKGSRL